MADEKITGLTEATAVETTDLLYMGRSPFGATDDRKITIENFLASVILSTNLKITNDKIDTIQDIEPGSSPIFAAVFLEGTPSTPPELLLTDTNTSVVTNDVIGEIVFTSSVNTLTRMGKIECRVTDDTGVPDAELRFFYGVNNSFQLGMSLGANDLLSMSVPIHGTDIRASGAGHFGSIGAPALSTALEVSGRAFLLPRFTDPTARDASITTPTAGMMCFITNDSGTVRAQQYLGAAKGGWVDYLSA